MKKDKKEKKSKEKKKMSKKTLIITIIAVIAVIAICASSFIVYRESTIKPTIKLNGNENITLSLNDEYVDKGATSKYKKEDISKSIKVSGEVDTKKVGTYTITYTSKYKKKTTTVKRTVVVKDTVAPAINLKGDASMNVYTNDTFTDPGADADDNYDGNLTEKITVEGTVDTTKEGTYELTYKVVDSSGNEAEIKRTVIVKDKPVPQIQTTGYVNTGSGGLPVLMYHFFYDDTIGETGNDANWMSKTDFESQMKYLSDNNFYFPSWQEVEDYVDGKISLPEKSVVVTIDDGDVTFINIAIPIIEKYNVKATSFAVGEWTAGWVKSLESSHLFAESHSYAAHKAGRNGKGLLVNMSYDEVVADSTQIANIVGSKMAYCYPFGHYNDTVISALQDVGYHLAFTTEGGRVRPGQNKMKLPRVRMSRGTSIYSFANKVG